MALKAIEEQRLEKKGLAKFLDKNKAHYLQLAKDAYEYTTKTLQGTGIPPRQDDVGEHLLAALEVDDDLNTYRETNKCTAAYWVRYCTNFILDRDWPTLCGAT